ncbi:DapH/DapD/GlmU-related protein [Citrobacter werkmanii]|uniref:DapH/DapD/GlmU-related protein n=1 Tax=Citrobacter werkmanii TaxID=67827 RepID=UPI003BAC3A15
MGHDVCIGANTIILDGVSIGNGALIGAGSVVTKKYSTVRGCCRVPCKVLYYRFDKLKQAELERAQWWLNDYDVLRRNVAAFKHSDPE